MNNTERFMKELEDRDYSKLKVEKHLVHFVKWRDRLAYYSLQLRPFFYEEPWDLPVVVCNRTYKPSDLVTLQGDGLSSVDYCNLLTDIEVALIEAASRRGIKLKKRPKIDYEGTNGSGSPRKRSGGWELDR